jgi:hypothetical protein
VSQGLGAPGVRTGGAVAIRKPIKTAIMMALKASSQACSSHPFREIRNPNFEKPLNSIQQQPVEFTGGCIGRELELTFGEAVQA